MTGAQRWMELFDDAIATQESRSESLEKRGASIATISGTLVTLLTAVAVFAGADKSRFTAEMTNGWVQWLIAFGLACFAIAVLASIAVQAPRRYRRVGDGALSSVAGSVEYWRSEDESVALWRSAQAKAKLVQAAADANRNKAGWLTAAYSAQALAIAAIASGLVFVVLDFP